MVEPAHPGSSHRLGTGACIFSRIILGFNGIMLSVVGDVPVDSEASVVTSSISRCVDSLSEVLIGVGFAYVCS